MIIAVPASTNGPVLKVVRKATPVTIPGIMKGNMMVRSSAHFPKNFRLTEV